MLNTVWNS